MGSNKELDVKHKEKSSQEEIDVFKAMMSMSPEELEKLKEQLYE